MQVLKEPYSRSGRRSAMAWRCGRKGGEAALGIALTFMTWPVNCTLQDNLYGNSSKLFRSGTVRSPS